MGVPRTGAKIGFPPLLLMYNSVLEVVDHLERHAHTTRKLRNEVTEEPERKGREENAGGSEETAHNLCKGKRSVCFEHVCMFLFAVVCGFYTLFGIYSSDSEEKTESTGECLNA